MELLNEGQLILNRVNIAAITVSLALCCGYDLWAINASEWALLGN